MSGPRHWQIACPAYMATGGPEALHQLAHAARSLGIDARMVYLDRGKDLSRNPTAEPYRIYAPVVDAALADDAGTLVVMPETATHRLLPLRRAQRAIWWLSMDNHGAVVESDRARWRRRWWKRWSGRSMPLHFDLDRSEPGIHHLAQSAYARQTLAAHGIDGVLMLTDYLRDDFLAQAARGGVATARQPRRVAYNPKKGLEATQALIAAAADRFEFVPIQHMTPAQVVELLSSASVYIDFGHHPGRDRIPREAVACGCRVLTGRRGAAGNAVDIPVSAALKIDEAAPDFAAQAVAALESLVGDSGATAEVFASYRETILAQQSVFTEEVRALARHLGTRVPAAAGVADSGQAA